MCVPLPFAASVFALTRSAASHSSASDDALALVDQHCRRRVRERVPAPVHAPRSHARLLLRVQRARRRMGDVPRRLHHVKGERPPFQYARASSALTKEVQLAFADTTSHLFVSKTDYSTHGPGYWRLLDVI